jgi:hypothetical protein
MVLIIGLGVGIGGCASELPQPAEMTDVARSRAYDIPPKQMVQRIREIVAAEPLRIPVTEDADGVLVTGFKEYPGEWHIARRWQERTRYRISVIPDWNDPAGKSRLEIIPETQQRAADVQEFKPAPELDRTERAAEVLRLIEQKLAASAPATP